MVDPFAGCALPWRPTLSINALRGTLPQRGFFATFLAHALCANTVEAMSRHITKGTHLGKANVPCKSSAEAFVNFFGLKTCNRERSTADNIF